MSSCGALWSWRTQSPSSSSISVISRALASFLVRKHAMSYLTKRVCWCPSSVVEAEGKNSSRSWDPSCGEASPPLEGVPHRWWPTPENTILIDDNPAKSILNPMGNIIFLDPWTGNKKDTFSVNKLAPYMGKLVVHPGRVPDIVRSNPIGNGALSPHDNLYRSIVQPVRFNELIWTTYVHVVVFMWLTYLMFVPSLDVFVSHSIPLYVTPLLLTALPKPPRPLAPFPVAWQISRSPSSTSNW